MQPSRTASHVRNRSARLLTRMSLPPPHDPIDALNQVLSEVIDVVQDVKQAHVKIPQTQALHLELDRLFGDLKIWAQLLMEQDENLGASPLASMPSVAGRTPANLWPGDTTDGEVRRVIGEHLDMLGEHVAVALKAQDDRRSQAALAEVERGLLAHRQALSEH
jgi:DNA-binding ferritin-like protein